jgi:hypothetical protein
MIAMKRSRSASLPETSDRPVERFTGVLSHSLAQTGRWH